MICTFTFSDNPLLKLCCCCCSCLLVQLLYPHTHRMSELLGTSQTNTNDIMHTQHMNMHKPHVFHANVHTSPVWIIVMPSPTFTTMKCGYSYSSLKKFEGRKTIEYTAYICNHRTQMKVNTLGEAKKYSR